MDWQQQATILITSPDGSQARIVVGACNVMDVGRQTRYLWQAQEYMRTHGAPADEETIFSDRTIETIALNNRAGMLAAFRRYEVLGEDGEWVETEIPPEWVAVETFCKELPAEIYSEWLEAAMRLNPGMFQANLTDEEKKGLSVTMQWSMNSPAALLTAKSGAVTTKARPTRRQKS